MPSCDVSGSNNMRDLLSEHATQAHATCFSPNCRVVRKGEEHVTAMRAIKANLIRFGVSIWMSLPTAYLGHGSPRYATTAHVHGRTACGSPEESANGRAGF